MPTPERVPPLISPEWASEHLHDPSIRFVDVEIDTSAYDAGHIPGAVGWSWMDDLVDPVRRELVSADGLTALLRRSGIDQETHVILYGEDDWYAAWALWQLQRHGLERTSLLDGGREGWNVQGLPIETATERPANTDVETDSDVGALTVDGDIRIGLAELRSRLGGELAILDVRREEEYVGELTAPAGYEAIAQRSGHIPGAIWAPWEANLAPDGRFRPVEELRERYACLGVEEGTEVVTYCGVGIRSAHTWFVLHELLGFKNVRNYDGGWAEWGSVIGAPIETGTDVKRG